MAVFSFSCHQHFKIEQYHNMKKKQAKEHTSVFGQFQSIEAFQHSVQVFQNLNIVILESSQCLPNKTYQLKSGECYGGKLTSICITAMAAANAMGNKLPMFVIGKVKNPQCFKNITFLQRVARTAGDKVCF